MHLVEAERETRALILIHGVVNITIGVGLLLWSNFSAENVLNRLLPWWLWPCMFIAAGICALFGMFSRVTAQFAFVFAGIVTLVFGLASLYAVIQGALVSVPTTAFLLYIAALKFYVAYVIRQRDTIVEKIAEATQVGQSFLDTVNDGAESTR
jgi:hypothetical protein